MDDDDAREVGSLLTNGILRSLARAPIRMRESGVMHAGWRMEISSDQGSGSIMLVELPDGRSVYRGDGMFLGWPREQLEATYNAMREEPDEPRFELNQLG
ncbi:MAG TPA: hypothetical protein VN380_06915 [Thermoanaerobaculia bacterium]|nr:hypothetical protein [Thermoanaerobaculia bacterium]